MFFVAVECVKKLKKTVPPSGHPQSYKKILVDTNRVINVAYTGPNVYPCVKKIRQVVVLINDCTDGLLQVNGSLKAKKTWAIKGRKSNIQL